GFTPVLSSAALCLVHVLSVQTGFTVGRSSALFLNNQTNTAKCLSFRVLINNNFTYYSVNNINRVNSDEHIQWKYLIMALYFINVILLKC
ncbi:hypothetical protein PDJAM_G00193810, partial [Pangasius djambal]|nr:hypothetical protein [Pangasius djambal]